MCKFGGVEGRCTLPYSDLEWALFDFGGCLRLIGDSLSSRDPRPSSSASSASFLRCLSKRRAMRRIQFRKVSPEAIEMTMIKMGSMKLSEKLDCLDNHLDFR
jgi:hypothetical protein